MGVTGIRVEFPHGAPIFETILSAAESAGGLPLRLERPTETQALVSFLGDEKGVVTLDRYTNAIFLADLSLVAPVMYRLLLQVLLELGGSAENAEHEALPLPLTADFVNRERRRVHLSAIAFMGLVAVVLSGIGFIVWSIWRY
jgi:hypothetical protein